MSKPFFLAKSGQIYGPYDRTEIETLRESGEYEKYTWFWDDGIARWQPIDPPPASPRASARTQPQPHAPAAQQQQQPQAHVQAQPQAMPSQWSVSSERLRSISVICHDHQSVVTGTLANVTEGGCEFIATSKSTAPEFQEKLPILLHLLDLPTGKSMNVSGRVGHIERRDGTWVYRIRWKHCPQILSDRGSASSAEAKI
jgi:hypothetical protein